VTELVERARNVLRHNDRGGYTVPTARLYPFQWNWDSAFVALGWATFDEPRAWKEIERLFEGQWADGLVPHIVFHAPSDDYFPGPEVWGTMHAPPTSGISQPPVVATAVRRLLDRAADPALAEERAAALYPKILAWHRWWIVARDPERSGLVGMLHPWESGMDNSPAWDVAFARVPAEPTTPVRRRDTGHVDPAMRPSDDYYRRTIYLVDLFRSLGWQPEAMWRKAPFKVVDPAINSILHRANRDLLALAGRFGSLADQAEIAARLETTGPAIEGLWNPARSIFQPLDLVTGGRIDVATSAGFLPLFAGAASKQQARGLADELLRWGERARYLVPSTDPREPGFEAKRYWRGPIWGIVNMMIADGLADHGEAALAARVRADTAALLRDGGFAEYFDPLSGDGLGGGTFSWTAAIALAWNLFDGERATAA
jgi:glycogen debranching enzyme